MRSVVAILICCSLTACAARATRPEPPRPDSLRSVQVARGVVHEYRWYATGPVAIHSLVVDPKECGIDFRTMKALDHAVGRVPTSALVRRASDTLGLHVLAATNSDFFSLATGVSEGPQISNGVLLKSEGVHREAIEDRLVRLQPVFAIDSKGRRYLTHTRLTGSVRAGALTVPLAGVNVTTRADSAFVFTRFYGDQTSPDTGALKVSVQRDVVLAIDTSATPMAIPESGFVLSVRGRARDTFSSLRTGDAMQWSASFRGLPQDLDELIAGYPMLLLNGAHVHHNEAGLRTTFSDRKHPRSAIAWGKDRRIHIFAVDGRRPGYSEGLSLQELADYLLAHGFTEAMNFDGGGSTTLVVNGQIVNRPTDQTGERAVSNALLVLGGRDQCKH
jgi:hypothetical protein